MKGKKRYEIIDFIKKNGQSKPGDIADAVSLSRQMTQRYLKELVTDGILEKTGSAPRVYYTSREDSSTGLSVNFPLEINRVLDEHFYAIAPNGKELMGAQGFTTWCQKREFDPLKKSEEFVRTTQKYQNYKKSGLLDATAKMQKTFGKDACIDELYYFDFYSVEVFGKTKMGQKLLYAKQSQDKRLMREIIDEIQPVVDALVKDKSIDAVAFVQPTVQRGVQFMNVLRKSLRLPLPVVQIRKIPTSIRVPQKTLKKLADRIENAESTFAVEGGASYKTVLVIDDAVGSGASINQISGKIKRQGIAGQVIGFAITGSLNDFEVISEV